MGRLNARVIQWAVPDLQERLYYMSGPPNQQLCQCSRRLIWLRGLAAFLGAALLWWSGRLIEALLSGWDRPLNHLSI